MMYTQEEQLVIDQALDIIQRNLTQVGVALTSSDSVGSYCRLKLSHLEHEVFGVLLLDNQHRLVRYVELFRGTIDGAAVYPREVVKLVLIHNAAAVIFTHNHPSGHADPSQADVSITQRLKTALNTVDVRVLDHIIVGESTVSFAERGLL